MPVRSRHAGGPILQSNITRRVDFALGMVAPLKNYKLIHKARRSSVGAAPRV